MRCPVPPARYLAQTLAKANEIVGALSLALPSISHEESPLGSHCPCKVTFYRAGQVRTAVDF